MFTIYNLADYGNDLGKHIISAYFIWGMIMELIIDFNHFSISYQSSPAFSLKIVGASPHCPIVDLFIDSIRIIVQN